MTSTTPPAPPISKSGQNDDAPKIIAVVVVAVIVVAFGIGSIVFVVHKRKTSQPFDPLAQQDIGDGLGRSIHRNQSTLVPLR